MRVAVKVIQAKALWKVDYKIFYILIHAKTKTLVYIVL